MRRENKESVREKILTAAEERFWRFGIKKTTIDEIAADADVGKGTVYLHFESKEEIAIAILTRYKHGTLDEQQKIAADKTIPVVGRIKKIMILPICRTREHCQMSPMVLELIMTIKPQLGQRLRALLEEEIKVIEALVVEANNAGVMHVEDPHRTAWFLKIVTLNYMPQNTVAYITEDPVKEISDLVDLMYKGLK